MKQAACPVIALLDVQDGAFIREAAKRGIFAYITDGARLRKNCRARSTSSFAASRSITIWKARSAAVPSRSARRAS